MTWRIDGSRARLKTDAFGCVFDLAQPNAGLQDVEAGGHIFPVVSLLGIRVPERPEDDPPVEAYVRSDDLVAKYPPRSRDLVSHHVYYRGLSGPAGVELILSAQTSLLDSEPCTEVFSSFGPAELLAKSAANQPCTRVTSSVDYDAANPSQFFLLRPENGDLSLILFVHPQDFFRASIRLERLWSISYWVFPHALEKGVIRRALFQLRVVPRDGDDLAAAALLEQAASASPPLAT